MRKAFAGIIALLLAGFTLAQSDMFEGDLGFVDPLIGTEGTGSEYGGMMPMVGVPFGSMHIVPATRTNGVSRTSFNALDRELLGFVLTRQPAIWMGEFGPLRIWMDKPLVIESIVATPYLTVVKAGGHTYEIVASSHVAFIRSDDTSLGAALPEEGFTSERTQRTSTRSLPNFRSYHVKRREGNVLKLGVSLISAEYARRNLEEELPSAFDDAVALVKSKWANYFSRIEIDADCKIKKIFYTALYHTLLYPRDLTERGRHYSGMSDKVCDGEGYNCFSLWDTYRAQHPWLTLIAPEHIDGMMQSLVNMYKEGGWLPLWPNLGYTGQMIGGPAEVVIAEAYIKGFRGFDAQMAWEAVRKNAMVPQVGDLERRWPGTMDDPIGPPETRPGLTRYMKNGYVAADETYESVSRTLDYAFDDHSVSAFARALGKDEEAKYFSARAKSYTNLWNSVAKQFWPRHSGGQWLDPSLSQAIGAYTETDPQTARWCVPHDVDGLVELMGGREAFIGELDRFFEHDFYRADVVGNKSVHGNETAHHLAYMYNRVGAYDRTCRRVRDILERCYSTDRKGFDGNEDCGQMSAWYILSALGFYPLDPASGYYDLGCPVVKRAKMRFGAPCKEAVLEIRVKNYAAGHWRVKRVALNGIELKDRRVRHSDLVNGGVLEFEMFPVGL